jgi:hypothetical protein
VCTLVCLQPSLSLISPQIVSNLKLQGDLMKQLCASVRSTFRSALAASALCALMLSAAASSSAAPKGIRVPQDYSTIQDAVNAATSGQTIHVGPGQWCGATISTKVDLEGDGGATIIGCSSPVEAFDSSLRVGFLLNNNNASGTTIRNFIFDGRGWSRSNLNPLAEGIRARAIPNVINNVTIEHDQFLGGVAGIADLGGGSWLISHNVFSGYSIDPITFFGGYAISFQDASFPVTTRATDNEASYNTISTTVPNGIVPNEFFILNPDIAFAGVIADSQDGLIIRNNKISIVTNTSLADGGQGAGIIVGDFGSIGFLTTTNTVIFNNDGRGSAYALIIPLDSGGLTGNTAGAAMRGNLGVNLINNAPTTIGNRSINSALTCSSSGVCQ